MPKTITIEDTIIKEVQIALVDKEYIMNVLYVTVDSNGNEYPRGWQQFKGKILPKKIINRLKSVLESAKEKVKEKESL